MTALQARLENSDDFLVGVELVSTRGMISETKASRAITFGRELAASPYVDWISITDNAGGNPMLAPAALGGQIRDAGCEVVIHLSCKDFNRNGLESEAWHLASEGFHNILALTGDYAGPGIAGGAKPVFDIDSVGLLTVLQRMNAGLEIAGRGSRQATRLDPTKFYPGVAVTNFKLHENEVIPQLLKFEKKIEAGGRWAINQIGYDSRKIHELIAWTRQRKLGHIPLIGNVYMLNPAVARVFRSQTIPGVVLSDELAAICEQQASSPDKGRSYFIELAARQIAIYRGLGYRGAYLGGVHSMEVLDEIMRRARAFSSEDWKVFAREIRYSRPGEFFCFAEDPETGLAQAEKWNPEYIGANGSRPRAGKEIIAYRLSKLAHDVMFTPGKGLWNAGVRLCAGAKDSFQGPAWMRAIEHGSKVALFGCRDCGDCSLPEIGFLCPESACAKNQRNGPCGGTRDGKCEVDDFECIWARAYDRLKSDGREQELLAHAPVLQDQNLRGTSSWANTWLGRDHAAKKTNPTLPETTPSNSQQKI